MHWGEMLVTVSLSDVPEGTDVRILHEGNPVAQVRDGHAHGWNGSFDKLSRCFGGELTKPQQHTEIDRQNDE